MPYAIAVSLKLVLNQNHTHNPPTPTDNVPLQPLQPQQKSSVQTSEKRASAAQY